jgi:hypothetical protein
MKMRENNFILDAPNLFYLKKLDRCLIGACWFAVLGEEIAAGQIHLQIPPATDCVTFIL